MSKFLNNPQLGRRVVNWTPPEPPQLAELCGRYMTLERLSAAKHGAELFAANALDDRIWDYLPYGPFATEHEYLHWIEEIQNNPDPYFYAIRNKVTGQCEGVASYLRIKPESGSIEIGHLNFSTALQRSPAATEAIYVMAKWGFEAGYRRLEWKCNALNLASRRAAQRFGKSYEGIFRQAGINKGRNRDTAWFAAIDDEWPALKTAFEAWLDPENFTSEGQQITRLSALTAPIPVALDPDQTS